MATIQVYGFDQLTPEAQQRTIEDYSESCYENIDTEIISFILPEAEMELISCGWGGKIEWHDFSSAGIDMYGRIRPSHTTSVVDRSNDNLQKFQAYLRMLCKAYEVDEDTDFYLAVSYYWTYTGLTRRAVVHEICIDYTEDDYMGGREYLEFEEHVEHAAKEMVGNYLARIRKSISDVEEYHNDEEAIRCQLEELDAFYTQDGARVPYEMEEFVTE